MREEAAEVGTQSQWPHPDTHIEFGGEVAGKGEWQAAGPWGR